MPESSSVESLRDFQEKVFARHVLFDLPFPVLGTFLVIALNSWLMQGRVSSAWVMIWAAWAIATTLVRVLFDRRMRVQVNDGKGYASTMRGFAALSIPTGIISGSFAWLYFDAGEPTTMIILGMYMAVVIVGAVVPTSVYLPAFYLLVLPAHLPYMVLLFRAGGEAHWVMLALNLMFLAVTFRYAHAANKMHLDSVRLRFENQHLIEGLGERKAAAESASKTKSLFLAGVSHDLKQPIRAMGLYLGVLQHTQRQERASVLDQVRPKMETALAELHGQVTRLLELSRLESGALEVQVERVELAELFVHLQSLFESQASSKGIRLHFADVGRRQHTAVWVDKRMLESILQNLISNAIKHTASGAVYVGTRVRAGYPAGRQLCIEVRDSGRGIPPEQQALLFDAYRSFDDRQANESHGLGLAIAKAQAGYLNATIVLRSAASKGSAFTVCGLSTAEQA